MIKFIHFLLIKIMNLDNTYKYIEYGYIYKIYSINNNYIYIGKTTTFIKDRLRQHMKNKNSVTLFICIFFYSMAKGKESGSIPVNLTAKITQAFHFSFVHFSRAFRISPIWT